MVYDCFNQITVEAGSILCISPKPTINDQWYELGQFGRLTSTSLQLIFVSPGAQCRSNIWAMVINPLSSGVACSHPKEDGKVMKSRKRPKPAHIYVLNIIYISPSGNTFLSFFGDGYMYIIIVYLYILYVFIYTYLFVYLFIYIYMLYIDIAMMFGFPCGLVFDIRFIKVVTLV